MPDGVIEPTTAALRTIREAAAHLRVAEGTVLRLIHRKALPATKVGRQWRIRADALDALTRAAPATEREGA